MTKGKGTLLWGQQCTGGVLKSIPQQSWGSATPPKSHLQRGAFIPTQEIQQMSLQNQQSLILDPMWLRRLSLTVGLIWLQPFSRRWSTTWATPWSTNSHLTPAFFVNTPTVVKNLHSPPASQTSPGSNKSSWFRFGLPRDTMAGGFHTANRSPCCFYSFLKSQKISSSWWSQFHFFFLQWVEWGDSCSSHPGSVGPRRKARSP